MQCPMEIINVHFLLFFLGEDINYEFATKPGSESRLDKCHVCRKLLSRCRCSMARFVSVGLLYDLLVLI